MNQRLLLGIHVASTAVMIGVARVWWTRGVPLAAVATLVYPMMYLWLKIFLRARRRRIAR